MGETGSQYRAFTINPSRAAAERQSPTTGGHPVLALGIFLLVVFVGGALLAPWLYWIVQALAPGTHLAANPFHRFLDRAFLVLAIAGMWPLLKALASGSPWGLLSPAASGISRRLAIGFSIGILSLGFMAVFSLASGAQHFQSDFTTGQYLKKWLAAALTAAVVPLLEETLFRGAVFGALRRAWNWRLALVFSAVVYAIPHFFDKGDLPGPVKWYTGFQLLPFVFKDFADPSQVIPAFLNLTLAGVILGLAYQRTGDLYCSMGIHAGWILWIKIYGTLIKTAPGTASTFWGTTKITDGWLALLVLAGLLLLLPRLLPPRIQNSAP